MDVSFIVGKVVNVIFILKIVPVVAVSIIMCSVKVRITTPKPPDCPFNALAYKVKCHNWASWASQIIHPELGRGQSNYPEVSLNVLIRFSSKDKYSLYGKH